MQEIQDEAIKTYLENLEYFKKHQPDLYERINMLSGAIDNEQYKERYHLEYIQEDKEFDIFDSHTETYLYNRKPKEFIETAVQNSNLDKENSVDILNPEIYNMKQKVTIDVQETIEFKTIGGMQNDIFDYIKIFQKSTTNPNKRFLKIEKFIFAGTLLGRHIKPIALKLKSLLLLIYEKNLEIFRLSLFTTNYGQIQNKHNIMLIFSIMEDNDKEHKLLKKFFTYEVYANHMLKFYSSNYNIGNFFDRLLSVVTAESPLVYNYQKIIDGLIFPVSENITKYPVLNTTYKHKILTNIPVLFIAAGPSLERNIEWVKKYKNRYFIVAVGAAVNTLISEGIIPDMITSADSDEAIQQQFSLEIRSKIQHIPFLAASSTFEDVLNIFPKENIILYELMCFIKRESKLFKGYSVGEVSLMLLSILGANHIYMLGTDLALDQETGNSHISGHNELKIESITTNQKEANHFLKKAKFSMEDATIAVKGNLRDIVITKISMINSITAYQYNMKIIQQRNPEIKIYNLNDGAYLEGMIPLKTQNVSIPLEDKKDIQMVQSLRTHSTLGLDEENIQMIKDCIIQINNLINVLKKLKKLKIKSYNELREKRERVFNILRQHFIPYSNFYADIIFHKYYLTMEAYLGFQFNEKLPNEKELISKVKIVWCDHMLRLASEYKIHISKLCKL